MKKVLKFKRIEPQCYLAEAESVWYSIDYREIHCEGCDCHSHKFWETAVHTGYRQFQILGEPKKLSEAKEIAQKHWDTL